MSIVLEDKLAAMERKIDELDSRAAINDLVTDYCQGFDNHNWKQFISIWHEDAVWEIGPPFGTFTRHDGIRKAVQEVLYPAWRETHHLCSNLRLTFHDADHCSGVCDVDCMGATADDVVQMINATYRDEFERREGIWKIARRSVTMHYFNPLPNVEMSAPD